MAELFDGNFVGMSLLSTTEWRRVQNETAIEMLMVPTALGMVEWDGDQARLLPDGSSALEDYRKLGADV